MAKWFTSLNDLHSASNEELEQSLLTLDGMGKTFKEKVLAELKKRWQTIDQPKGESK